MKKFLITFLLLPLFSFSQNSTKKIIIVISANSEWKALKKYYQRSVADSSVYGEWFDSTLVDASSMKKERITFFHEGWGKISAAGGTQFVIDRWHPDLLINIGTCGGFAGLTKQGDLFVVTKATTYDIHELMGDSREAIDYYSANCFVPDFFQDNPWQIKVTGIVSADQDIDPAMVDSLKKKYHAIIGDWESSSIAFVASRNNTKCIILRGVADVIYPEGDVTYGNVSAYDDGTQLIMSKFLQLLPAILSRLE